MSISLEYVINDIRQQKEFDKKSFSGFSTKAVFDTLKKSISDNKIEEACHWTIELILSLQTTKLYDLFLSIAIKQIHICNPNLPTKLFNRYKLYLTNNLSNVDSRNSQVIRNHLIELCVIITYSKKNKSINLAKIKDDEFDIKNIISKLMAPQTFIDAYIKQHDPDEIKVILNEFLHNMLNKNYEGMLYWISWIIHYEKNLNKKKKVLTCSKRYNSDIKECYHTDIVWLIWEIVIQESNKHLNKACYTQIVHLFKLYKLLYKQTSKYKYIHLLLFALKYVSNIFNINESVCAEPHLYIQATMKVNTIIGEKKQFERYKSNIHFSNQLNINRDNLQTKHKKIKNQLKQQHQQSQDDSLTKFERLNKIEIHNHNQIKNKSTTLHIMSEIEKKI
jgi:hypothetical protein